MSADESGSLKRRNEQIILALLQHSSMEKAAQALGVSDVTLWRWMKKPKFQEEFRRARREAFSQAIARLQQSSAAAVSTLLRVMVDQSTPASSRIRAASCVLDNAIRAMELEDIETRLSRLEQLQPHDPGLTRSW
jgi:hypothetical protein